MVSASSLGVKSATFKLVESAIQHKKLNQSSSAAPLQRLALLAKQGDPSAMVIQGKALSLQGKNAEASKWYCAAIDVGDFDGLGEALTLESALLRGRKDDVGAEKLIRRAALELDDPLAYFKLSEFVPEGSPEQTKYLLKAASSGISAACHKLGVLEMQKIKALPREVKGVDGLIGAMKTGHEVRVHASELRMAIAWFEVAAEEGNGESMLILAVLLQAAGFEKEALKSLAMAEALQDLGITKRCKMIREQWER